MTVHDSATRTVGLHDVKRNPAQARIAVYELGSNSVAGTIGHDFLCILCVIIRTFGDSLVTSLELRKKNVDASAHNRYPSRFVRRSFRRSLCMLVTPTANRRPNRRFY